ncbi:riboflavin aldehyde-forming enzyme [Metarhizium album ARSEF 1941]|uniref:Riboflavin aldehyde-forming enzyme n=1 Tax=Metarhizium album (strain ARSEF 1941) TaxID=1081103 RepID=A0A0B2WSL4_METAS|nr:riboflavin aldehyde-forming enzyme [Metarhizium album ARSEF 1941]KHN96614.1 riboflavin aldehyde-forming enzyme [Metarhizium album ARSEF 1941]
MKCSVVAYTTFVAAVAAQPHHGNHKHHHVARAVQTVVETATEVCTVTEYVDGTSVSAYDTCNSAQPTPTLAATPTQPQEVFHETVAPEQPDSKAVIPPPAPTSSTPVSVAPPAPTSSTSVYVAPPAPTSSAPAYVAPPAPPSTSVYAPPPSDPKPPSSSAPSSGTGGQGEEHTGDMTYYAVGMGSCGFDDSGKDNSENIVAVSHLLMGTQSNGNPMCGRKVTVVANGESVTGVVRDKCMGCDINNIDVSEKMFKKLYKSLDGGRVTVKWFFS